MAKDWKVVTFDTVTKTPKHEEWDTVVMHSDGWIMTELHRVLGEEDGGGKKCVKRRYYPAVSVIYIEEMGLESSS